MTTKKKAPAAKAVKKANKPTTASEPKSDQRTRPAVVVTYKHATPPPAAKPLFTALDAMKAAEEANPDVVPVQQPEPQKVKRNTETPQAQDEPPVASVEEESAVADRMALAAKAGKKKPSSAQPSVAPAPLKDRPMVQQLRQAEFKFIATQAVPGFGWAHGYQHKDGRGALYSHNVALTEERWALLMPAGVVAHATLMHEGVKLADLKLAIMQTTKSALNKAAHRLAADARKTAEGLAGTEGMTMAESLAATKPTVVVPAAIAGVPTSVARAVEMLGGQTLQQFNLDLLRGDKNYGKRMALLKKLFNRDRVLVAETGINNLVQAFYSAVGVGKGSAAAKAVEFAKRCKAIATAIRSVKSKATKTEKAVITAELRRTVLARTVPGKILDVAPALSKKQQAAADSADRQILAHMLAVSPEQPAVPRPGAEVVLVAGDIRLLEDPANGLVMMQMERQNSQGAICIYNNGVRVAAGVVPPETLKTLRVVPGEVDLVKAANQLLNPIVPSVPVTPVAARHLTAVLHCKELIMADAKVSKSSKFAPPAEAANKAEKATPKASKKSIAAGKHTAADKAERAPRTTEDRKITALFKPKEVDMREGTFCYSQVMAAITSKTVSEAQAKLDADKANPSKGRRIEIAWLAKKGYIKVA